MKGKEYRCTRSLSLRQERKNPRQKRADAHILANRSAIDWASSFIDRFEGPLDSFATIHDMERKLDGTLNLMWVEYSPTVRDFADGFYEKGLMVEFDWARWKRAEKLFADSGLIARASAMDCLKLVTLCLRKDRFVEGFLAHALKRGVITNCLKRLTDLRRELE